MNTITMMDIYSAADQQQATPTKLPYQAPALSIIPLMDTENNSGSFSTDAGFETGS